MPKGAGAVINTKYSVPRSLLRLAVEEEGAVLASVKETLALNKSLLLRTGYGACRVGEECYLTCLTVRAEC